MEPPVFQFVPTASGPVTRHHSKEPRYILFAPSLQVFMHFKKIPLRLVFSRLKSPSFLSLSSYVMCSRPFAIFVALHRSLSIMSMSPLC